MGRQTDIPSYRERQTDRDKQTNFKLDDFKQGRCVCACMHWCVSVSVHLGPMSRRWWCSTDGGGSGGGVMVAVVV